MAWLRMGGGGGSSEVYTKYTFITKSTGDADASIYVKKYLVNGNTETMVYNKAAVYTDGSTMLNDGVAAISYPGNWRITMSQPYYYNDIHSQEQSAGNITWGYRTTVNYTICVL